MIPEEVKSGPRKLPSLYMGPTLFFSDRQDERVAEHFGVMRSFLDRSLNEAVYTLQAVKVDGRFGLYARDFFNRSVFRRRLMRQGMQLSDRPFVTFDGQAFETSDWGKFEPDFVIFGDMSPEDSTRYEMGAGEIGFALMTYRMGKPDVHELRCMLQIGREIHPFVKEDASEVVAEVRRLGR